ncbi:MAG: phosphotransferase, partial [Spirochaetales bacterium]|nr:phosphotransferase [Spirochaetales bacterium]
EDLGEPLFVSRSSKIYKWEDNILLKLFNENIDPELIKNEQINTTETYKKGVSMVKCLGQVDIGTQKGLLLLRVGGETLISLAGSKPVTAFGVPKLMAKLQEEIHGTGTEIIRSYKDMVIDALSSEPLSFLTFEEKQKAINHIELLPDGNSILHLDYHPDNIMSDGEAATIIDWMTAASGCPAADVAATLYLLREGEMIPGLNRAVALVLEVIRKMICSKYYAAYKADTGLTDEEVKPWRLPFLIVRLGVWNIETEVKILQKKIREELKE